MNDMMLYLHFPFCRKKCGYCDFYSICSLDMIDDYISRMIDDIRQYSEYISGRKISSVYLGGGTPSIMGEYNARRLFDALNMHFDISDDAEISFEVNPESTDHPLIKALKECGVNRISMGVQSASDDELSLIGRIHDFSAAREKYQIIRECGIENINLDLMYGLPGQSLEAWQDNLEKITSLSPEHISFYALTLSENVPLYSERENIPNDDILRKMYLYASGFLSEKGYSHYEISNAAKPGCESRHNLGYWQRKEYLGIGASAHSFIGNKRFSMASDAGKYISENIRKNIICDEENLSEEDEFTEFIFLSLRTDRGIDLEYAKNIFGSEKEERIRKVLSEISEHSLAEKTARGYRLTPEGFFVSDSIIMKII